jgi:hypothetical protein
MKWFFILCLAGLFQGRVMAQIGCSYVSTGTDCEDAVRTPDKYHFIGDCYDPVCGCDDKTYRSSEAAYYWGAINSWSEGSCGAFDLDVAPNIVTSVQDLKIRIYMKQPGTVSLVIYNSFGRKMQDRLFNAAVANTIIPDVDGYAIREARIYPRGVYFIIGVVNGEQKIRKFLVVQP